MRTTFYGGGGEEEQTYHFYLQGQGVEEANFRTYGLFTRDNTAKFVSPNETAAIFAEIWNFFGFSKILTK